MRNSKMEMLFIAVAVIATALVVADLPFATVLPIVLFLTCPLMMLLTMRMMGRHGSGRSSG